MKNVWKPIYLAILITVTVVIGAVTGAIHLGRFIGLNIAGWKNTVSNYTSISENKELENFDSLDVNMNVGEVIIVYGDKNEIEYECPDVLAPIAEVKNGTLKITQKSANLMGININVCSVTITVKKDTELKELKADMSAGNLEIKGIKTAVLDVKDDAGNIEMKDVEAETLKATTDAGNIEVKDSKIGSANLKADAGRIASKDSTFKTLEGKADAGSIEFKDIEFEEGKFESSLGSIEIKGEFTKLEAECSLGSIDVKTSDDLTGKTMDLKTDLGNVSVNGKDRGTSFKN